MNLREIKELMELVSEKGFAEFEIERQGFRLRISRFKEPPTLIVQPTQSSLTLSPISAPLELPSASSPRSASATSSTATTPSSSEVPAPVPQLHTIKSPIVGTFFRSVTPTSEPFVNLGDRIDQDTVVCIIEAMKLMNEIQAEVAGEIVEIHVENGQPVEYGQPLFGVRT